MRDFSGKVVAITGAASGIGREIALAFARRGARLSVCDIDGERLGELKGELQAIGCEHYGEVVDVAQAWQVEEYCEHTYREMGRVDVLCNNAGVGMGGLLEETSLDDWKWIVGINLWGVIHGCHYFYPRMIDQGGGGHIVNVASGAGLAPLPVMTGYCCTKYGVVGLSETLRGEAAVNGIGVTVVCPGVVSTDIVSTSRMLSGTESSSDRRVHEKVNSFFKRKGGPPDRVARDVIRAVERNRGVVASGRDAKLLDLAHRVSRSLSGSILRLTVRLMDRLM